MPDIDIDFDERRRGDVIRYVTEKYGDDRVAQIITYGTIKAKAAVKDSARVLGFPYALGRPDHQGVPARRDGQGHPAGRDLRRSDTRATARPARSAALYEAEAEIRQVIDTARGLEGLIRQAGVHAAGVIMSSEPIIDHVPVWKREADGAVITQFDYPACESLGLLKMDFLGLRNLTVLDDAVRGVKANRGIDDRPRRPCRWTTSPPMTCWPGATRWASSSSTAARCGPCCAACGRTTSRTSRRSARCTGRARWAPTRTTSTPTGRTARKPVVPHPPRAGRAAGRHPGRHLRADRLPGAGHGDRAEAGRVQPRQRGPAPPGHGQEEKGDPGQGVRAVRGGDEGATATPTRRSRRCGTSWSRSPTTRSTRRTAPPTAWCPTGPPTSRPTTRPSTWRAAHLGRPGTRTRALST